MANILLTEKCVRSCPYCFAKKHMDDSPPDDILSFDDLIYITDFIENSGEKQMSLLGGEPTLHPDFVDFVMYLFQRDFHVTIFTSGIMSESKLDEAVQYLSDVELEKLSFVCNMNHPDETPPQQMKRTSAFLEAFGKFTSLGYNIYQPQFNMEFLFDTINRYGLKRHLRLGLAHPIPGEINKYVAISEMPEMVECLMSYSTMFELYTISPGFDCGFPMCLFTEQQIGFLYKLNGGRVSFGCGPAIDIGPDLNVWCCFPLSNFNKKSLYDFNTIKDIIEFYRDLHKKMRIEIGGVFEKCDTCRYREIELCMGGCLAHIISWFQNEARGVRAEEAYS